MTVLVEALREGRRVRAADVNFVYKMIPGAIHHKKTKIEKIKLIQEKYDEIAMTTLKVYYYNQIEKNKDDGHR